MVLGGSLMSTPVQFPDICPKGPRRLSVGRYPSYATQFRSGSSQIRKSGTAVYDLTFDVDFGSIRNSEAGMVMKAYLDSMGSSYRVLISTILFKGVSTDILDLLPAVEWHFAAPPTIRAEDPGWASTSVQFQGDSVFVP